jgi:uncharacterized phage protein (TIGR01671 family)
MREIKFRAWDTEEKFYTHSEAIYLRCDGLIFLGNENANERFIIEQFTGLRDKTGRGIYAGDILEVLSHNGTGSYKKMIGEVFFKTQGSIDYCYRVKTHGNFSLNSNETNGYTIIGNIHENPELLKCS